MTADKRPQRRILITGSRDWTDWAVIESALRAEFRLGSENVVVHGAAKGADSCAHVLAKRMGLGVDRYPAPWEAPCAPAHRLDPLTDKPWCPEGHRKERNNGVPYCPSMGKRRNQHMVNLGADVCLAFPRGTSRGTRDCIRRAEKAGIPVKVIEWDEIARPA